MNKIILSIIVIAGFLGFAFYYNKKSPSLANITSSNVTTTNPTQTPANSAGSPTLTSSSAYKDGQYLGSVADALYGNVQIKLIIKNGKITDAVFLQYPTDARHSQEVSAYSLPILKQEIISAQTAQVDNVTGATQTTRAFIQSVQSALDKAKS